MISARLVLNIRNAGSFENVAHKTLQRIEIISTIAVILAVLLPPVPRRAVRSRKPLLSLSQPFFLVIARPNFFTT